MERIEEGIEILTGVKAGIRTDNKYETNTVFYLVEKKIKELFRKSKAARTPMKRPKTKKTVIKRTAAKKK